MCRRLDRRFKLAAFAQILLCVVVLVSLVESIVLIGVFIASVARWFCLDRCIKGLGSSVSACSRTSARSLRSASAIIAVALITSLALRSSITVALIASLALRSSVTVALIASLALRSSVAVSLVALALRSSVAVSLVALTLRSCR